METKRILVTGGAGFMGSWLVDELIGRGHELISTDSMLGGYRRNISKDCTFVKMDLRRRGRVDSVMKGVDMIYHLAAYAAEGQSLFSPVAINDLNTTPMNNLLVAAVNEGVQRFVFTSSMAVYGDQEPPFSEEFSRKPVDPYGIGKAYCESMLEVFAQTYGFEHCIIRPHNVYGPRQNIYDPYRNVLGIWMNRILRGKPPIIYGDGEQLRAFSYIEDATPALANAGLRDEANGEIINLGSEEVASINHACKIVLETTKSKLQPVHVEERTGEVKNAYSTTDKSIELLGYRTRHTLREGIAKMADWVKAIGPHEPTYTLPLEISRKAPSVLAQKLV